MTCRYLGEFNKCILDNSIRAFGCPKDCIKCEEKIPTFCFSKKECIIARGGTPGFQPKFKRDKYFFKSQAELSGTLMNDWLVEIIASKFAQVLGIPTVKQYACKIQCGNRENYGVFSKNFELDGNTFISLASLANRIGYDLTSPSFLKLSSDEKLREYARIISNSCELDYDSCEKYLVDLAVSDILVCNTDRHTHNFGVFWNSINNRYEIPLTFDYGMGLFESDYGCKSCQSFDDAMYYAYIAPYGEDPLDMLQILKKNFDLSRYQFKDIILPKTLPNDFSKEYIELVLRRFLE